MSRPEILEKSPMNVNEVKAAIESIRKLDPEAELNFRAAKTDEYSQELAKLTVKKAEELFSKLQALDVPRVKENHLHKLIDLLPTNEKQCKMILAGYHLTVKNEDVKKIVDAIGEFV